MQVAGDLHECNVFISIANGQATRHSVRSQTETQEKLPIIVKNLTRKINRPVYVYPDRDYGDLYGSGKQARFSRAVRCGGALSALFGDNQLRGGVMSDLRSEIGNLSAAEKLVAGCAMGESRNRGRVTDGHTARRTGRSPHAV